MTLNKCSFGNSNKYGYTGESVVKGVKSAGSSVASSVMSRLPSFKKLTPEEQKLKKQQEEKIEALGIKKHWYKPTGTAAEKAEKAFEGSMQLAKKAEEEYKESLKQCKRIIKEEEEKEKELLKELKYKYPEKKEQELKQMASSPYTPQQFQEMMKMMTPLILLKQLSQSGQQQSYPYQYPMVPNVPMLTNRFGYKVLEPGQFVTDFYNQISRGEVAYGTANGPYYYNRCPPKMFNSFSKTKRRRSKKVKKKKRTSKRRSRRRSRKKRKSKLKEAGKIVDIISDLSYVQYL